MVHGILFLMAFGAGLYLAFLCGVMREQDRLMRNHLREQDRQKSMMKQQKTLWDEYRRNQKNDQLPRDPP
jgi:hypothetical protein